MQFPKEFEGAHLACFYMHDVMVEFIRSGEEHEAFIQNFDLTEVEKHSLESTDLHILEWLEENKRYEDRSLVLRTVVLPAVLSDMLHCIFEGLTASKKGKMAVAYMLLRKPLQESLYLLESMALDETDFVNKLSDDPLFLRPKNGGGPEGHTRRINKILSKIGLNEALDGQYISELRYDKQSYDSFDRVCNHAMHLFTEHNAIKTELLNINFVFSEAEQIYTQQRYIYTRLPYLLYYAYHLFEHIAAAIAPTTPDYFMDINRRIAAYILLAYLEMDEEFVTEQMDKLAACLQNFLGINLVTSTDLGLVRDCLLRLGESGELEHIKKLL